MTTDPRTPISRRLPARAMLEIAAAVAVAAVILGVGWYNLDSSPDPAPPVAGKSGEPGNAGPLPRPEKPAGGPMIVERPPPRDDEPPLPRSEARAPEQAEKPASKPAPSVESAPRQEQSATAQPGAAAQPPAPVPTDHHLRAKRLAEASFYEINRGDPVSGALLALEGLSKVPERLLSPAYEPVHRALYAAHFANREIRVYRGHRRFVRTAEFSPDGTRIVTGSRDETARLWDPRTGQSIAELAGHDGEVWTARFSRDGKLVVTASFDGTARLWDGLTGEDILVLKGHEDEVTSARFSPVDGKSGPVIVTSSADGTARIWSAKNGATLAILFGHSDRVRDAVFSPDGRTVVTVSSDNTARLWNARDGREIAVLKGHQKYVSAAAFDPAGKRVATASADGTARIWDAKTGAEIAVLRGHGLYIHAVAFSPDGTRISTASWGDKTARLWDAQSGEAIAVLRGHTNWVNAANFSPDSSRVVTASGDGTARLWDSATGALIAVLGRHVGYVYWAEFTPDGKQVITASGDGSARLWDAGTGLAVSEESGEAAVRGAARIATTADDSLLASAEDDHTVRIQNRSNGDTSAVLRGHSGPVLSVVFDAGGGRLATASADGTARLWDVTSGLELARLSHQGIATAEFSPDGNAILTRDAQGTMLRHRIFPDMQSLAAHLKSIMPRELTRQQRIQNFLALR